MHCIYAVPFTAYELDLNLRYVKLYFDTSTFDKITEDQAATPVDKLSAIGGTMGLLTGFSLISGVEIIYYLFKIFIEWFEGFKKS